MISGCLACPGINKISHLKKQIQMLERLEELLLWYRHAALGCTSGQHLQTCQFICIMQGLEEFASTQGIVHLHVFKC